MNNTIISSGGGFFNVPNISKIGKIVYLHSDFNQILEAIYAHPNAKKKIKKRPLLKDLTNARVLLETRLPLYRNLADVEINVGGRTIEDIADEIITRLKLKKQK